MDALGERIVRDSVTIAERRRMAIDLEKQAAALRREADEIERLLALARLQR